MNALGLPGASIDGILGFTILARFRLEIDPTRDAMTWTRLDHAPPDPPIPHRGDGDRPPAEVQVMNALGPLAKGLAFLMGKQPEEEREPRGFLGLEWAESHDAVSGQSACEDQPGHRRFTRRQGRYPSRRLPDPRPRPVGNQSESGPCRIIRASRPAIPSS